MEIVKQKAMVLLYQEPGLNSQVLKNSLDKFCITKNISIIEIMTLYDEYDYLSLKRIFQIIKYCPETMNLITNRKLQNLLPMLAIFSILDTLTSGNAIDLILNFLNFIKKILVRVSIKRPLS